MLDISGTTRSARDERIASMGKDLHDIVDSLISCNPNFADMDIKNLNKNLNIIINKTSLETLNKIGKDELRERVEKIMLLESMVSAFKDLTPDQKKQLDE